MFDIFLGIVEIINFRKISVILFVKFYNFAISCVDLDVPVIM